MRKRVIFVLLFLFLFFFSASASAERWQPISESKRVVLPLSRSEITRLSLVHDRIAQCVGPKGSYRLESNVHQGDIYLQPITPRAFTVFLHTERGRNLTLLITPVAMPGDSVRLEVTP